MTRVGQVSVWSFMLMLRTGEACIACKSRTDPIYKSFAVIYMPNDAV
jgi:hypothetical protein